MMKVNTVFLNKLGLIGTVHSNVMQAEYRYGGLNFRNLYVTAGIKKVQLLIGHQRKIDETSKRKRITLSCAQQWVGLSSPTLTLDYTDYSYICERSWISFLWEFFSSFGGKITLTDNWKPAKRLRMTSIL